MKYHRAAHQLGQEDSQKLSEDVTERQQIQEADRMKPAFVLQIFLNFQFQRRNVGENIAVRDHNSLWLGGGAGSEDDFERVGRLDTGGGGGGCPPRPPCVREIFPSEGWDGRRQVLA